MVLNGFAMNELEQRRCPWDMDANERADQGGPALDFQAKQNCVAP